MRRLAAAVAAHDGPRRPRRSRPAPPRRLGPAGDRHARGGRPAVIFTTGGYVADPGGWPRPRLRVPVVMWEGNVIPGRACARRPGSPTALAVTFEETCAALHDAAPRRALLRHRDADPRSRDATARPPACGWTCRPAARAVRLRRLAGGAPVQRRGAGAIGAAGRARHRDAHDRRRRRTPRRSRREALPASCAPLQAVPVPPRRDDRGAGRGGPVVGRAGSSTLAEAARSACPMVVVPYPHAAGHQRPMRARSPRPARRASSPTRTSTPRRCVEAAELLDDPARTWPCGRGPRARAARRRPRRSPTWSWPPPNVAAAGPARPSTRRSRGVRRA